MDEPFPGELWAAQDISRRILQRNQNAIAVWIGGPGTGKSYSALRLAELVDENFTADRIIFRSKSFLKAVAEDADIGRGSVLLWDEAGLGMPAREWQSFSNRAIGYVLQSFRYRNLALFITVPDHHFMDAQARALFHYIFECDHVNATEETVVAKPFIVQHAPRVGQTYIKYPRIGDADGSSLSKLTQIRFRKPSNDLVLNYEGKRADFIKSYYADLVRGQAERLKQTPKTLRVKASARPKVKVPIPVGKSGA